MKKTIYSIFFVLILSNFAWAGMDIRVSAREIKRVVALEKGRFDDELEVSAPQSKYNVEIERMAQARTGGYKEVNKNVGAWFGLLYREGFTIKSRKELMGLHELASFDDSSLKAALNFGDISYINVGEEYTYEVEGTTIFSPSVKNVGLWITVGGTWSLTIKRESVKHFILSVSLLSSKDGSVSVFKGWAYGGYGISRSLEQGLIFDIVDEEKNVQNVVTEFLGGDIRPLQELSTKNKSYKLIEKSDAKSESSFKYFGMSSPYLSWLLVGLSASLSDKESQKKDESDKIISHEKSSSFVVDQRVQLLKYLTSSRRMYQVMNDVLNVKNDKSNLQSTEIWESEWSEAMTSQVEDYLKLIEKQTQQANEFQVKMPDHQNAGYAKVQLEIKYNPENFLYLQRNLDLIDKMRREAQAQLVVDFQKKFEEVSHSGNAPTLYNLLTNERLQQVNNLNASWGQLKKYLKGELTLENRARIMRSLFQSPYMYKQWFELSKHCGLSYKLTISSTNFNLFIKEQKFEQSEGCR